MRSFDVAGRAASQGGEYVLGMKDLHSDACYLIYGILDAGETEREVRPGRGHEEILCAVDGSLRIRTDRGEMTLEQGRAVQVKEDDVFLLANPLPRPVIYVAAGGPCRSDRTERKGEIDAFSAVCSADD